MRGATAKRGTHGLRKRCPVCKKLRRFSAPELRAGCLGWTKERGRWLCPRCSARLDEQRRGPVMGLDRLTEVP